MTRPLAFAVAAALSLGAAITGRAQVPEAPAAPAPAPAPAGAPATQPDPAAENDKIRRQCEEEQARLPQTRVGTLRDAVQFTIENDDLVVRTSIPPTEQTAVIIDGEDGFLTVSSMRGGDEGAGSPYVPSLFQLKRQRFPDGGYASAQVSVIGLRVQVSRGWENALEHHNVELIQSNEFLEEGENRVRFYVQVLRNDETVEDLKLEAVNVVELRRKYPVETMRYLEPIFREFRQASVLFQVNARAAWQVLGGAHEPPAEVNAKVDELLKRLDAESPQDRAAALAELEKLGQPAALALMRRDRKGLSEEQLMRVETFLAPYKPLPDDEAAKLRSDPEFLLLALAAEDAALANLALDRLKQVAKREIAFDAAAKGQARTDAIARLRAQLLPAATRPVTTRSAIQAAPAP